MKQEPVDVLDAHARVVQGFRENLWHLRPAKKRGIKRQVRAQKKKSGKSKEEGMEHGIGTWDMSWQIAPAQAKKKRQEAGQQSITQHYKLGLPLQAFAWTITKIVHTTLSGFTLLVLPSTPCNPTDRPTDQLNNQPKLKNK